MKRIIWQFMVLALFGVWLRAQTVTVTAQHLGGTEPYTGVVFFQPTLANGTPASVRLGGGGQTITSPISTYATQGVFSVVLPDTSMTTPANVCFAVTAMQKGKNVLGPGYSCVQPASSNGWCTAGACNFDTYTPNISPLTMAQPFVAAINGMTGQLTFIGAVSCDSAANTCTFTGSGGGARLR